MSQVQSPPFVPDDTDQRIITMLKANGRATNQEIARALKVAPTTVSVRIRRLEKARALRVVAVTDFSALGYDVLLAIGIEVEGRAAEEVGDELARLPQVFSVHLVTGARDLEVLVALKEFGELRNFLERDVARIRGVRRLTTGIAVDMVKFNFDVAPMQ